MCPCPSCTVSACPGPAQGPQDGEETLWPARISPFVEPAPAGDSTEFPKDVGRFSPTARPSDHQLSHTDTHMLLLRALVGKGN